VATAVNDSVVIWDSEAGQVNHVLGRIWRKHWHDVNSASFSPDGKWVVTGSRDSTAKIWDSKTDKLIYTLGGILSGQWKAITSASFSPDGNWVVTGSYDETATIWSLQKRRLLSPKTWWRSNKRLRGHNREVNSVSFSPDGKRVLTGSSDGTAKIWDSKTGKLIHTLSGHDGYVKSASFSSDGKLILTASGGTARVWDSVSGKEIQKLSLGGNFTNSHASFSPDGSMIATTFTDKNARNYLLTFWKLVTPQLDSKLLEGR